MKENCAKSTFIKTSLLVCTLLVALVASVSLVLTTNVDEAWADTTVYIPKSGAKYHYDSSCSNMRNPQAVSLSEAQSMGYTACAKCAGGHAGSSSNSSTKSSVKAGWKSSASGWWYQNSNGSYPKSAWKKISGAWYYFNKAGYMQTGWTKVGAKWYYLGSSGKMSTGWKKIDGKWYYLGSSGAMSTGWKKVGKTWYYFDGSGVMQTGWQTISGKTYYFKSSGAMLTGWQKLSGKWYFFNKSGAMVAGKWQGNYYLQNDGTMATNRWVGQYYVGKDGAWDKRAKGESVTGVGKTTLHYENKHFALDLPSSWKGKWTITGFVDENRSSIGVPNYTYIIYVGDKVYCLIHAHGYNIGGPDSSKIVGVSKSGHSIYIFDKGSLSSDELNYIESHIKVK